MRVLSLSRFLSEPLLVGFVILCLSTDSTMGQIKDYENKREVEELVDKTNEYENEERKKLEKRIVEIRKNTLDKLERLVTKYTSSGDSRSAAEASKAIGKLEKEIKANMGGSSDVTQDSNQLIESDIIEFGVEYVYKSDQIEGVMSFGQNKKANAIFRLNDEAKNLIWDFVVKEDHLLIQDASILGKVYISEVPKSGKKEIMIRWGGDLRGEVMTAEKKN